MSELNQTKCEARITQCQYTATVMAMYSTQGLSNPEGSVAPIVQDCLDARKSELLQTPEGQQALENVDGCYLLAYRGLAKALKA